MSDNSFSTLPNPHHSDTLSCIHKSLLAVSFEILLTENQIYRGSQTAFAQFHEELGAAEVLIYNAGAYLNAGILALSPEQFELAWKVNCFGAFLATQQVLPARVQQQRGTILLTNATAAQKGSARFAALAVGKFGLRALAQSLAREFGQGIHIANIVIGGIINTPRTRSMMQERDSYTLLSPDAITQTYWQLY